MRNIHVMIFSALTFLALPAPLLFAEEGPTADDGDETPTPEAPANEGGSEGDAGESGIEGDDIEALLCAAGRVIVGIGEYRFCD